MVIICNIYMRHKLIRLKCIANILIGNIPKYIIGNILKIVANIY